MPRQARIKSTFSIYHVILRGNEGKKIFFRKRDKTRFLEILHKVVKKYNCHLYSYCLMNNHIHLIIYDNGNDISIIVKSLATRYAMYFNKAYHRKGHLFLDRFRSEIIDNDDYLLRASRYIHNNPVKAFLADSAADYHWSSYHHYTGNTTEYQDLVNTDKVLKIISNNLTDARCEYIRFVDQAPPDTDIDKFIDVDEGETTAAAEEKEYIQNLEAAGKRISELMAQKKISRTELSVNRKKRNEIIREIRKNSALTLKEIGSMFALSESAVCKILNRE
ncbi:MAG TPA: transposase [Bacillota bacterium]|nr:transposase [Bacillota bacterium]